MASRETIPERWVRWKDTNWFVSDEGRVKEMVNGVARYHEGCRDDKAVRIQINKRKMTMQRLVWEAFRGEVPEGYVIRHINGCITMNDLFNLEIVPKSIAASDGAMLRTYRIKDKLTGKVYNGIKNCAQAVRHSVNTIRTDANGEKKRFEFIREGR